MTTSRSKTFLQALKDCLCLSHGSVVYASLQSATTIKHELVSHSIPSHHPEEDLSDQIQSDVNALENSNFLFNALVTE